MNESNSPIMALTKFFRNIDYDKIISNAETLLESMKKYSNNVRTLFCDDK